MNYRKGISVITLLLCDVITIIVAYIIAYFLRTPILSVAFIEITASLPFQIFILRFYLVIPYIAIIAYEELYNKRFEFWEETRLLWKSNLIATAIVMIILYITKGFLVSRAIVLISFVINLILLPVQRNIIKKILFRLHLWTKNILIIGSKTIQEQLQKQFLKHPTLGYKQGAYLESIDDLERKSLNKIVSEHKINGIIVDAQIINQTKILKIYEQAEGKVEDFFVIPALTQLQAAGVEIEQMENILLMKYRHNLLRTESRIAKRIVELLIAIIAFIVLIPVFLIISLLIKLSSQGPVYFVQERVGKDNKLFRCYKFRTMYLDAPARLEKLLKLSPEAKMQWDKYLKIPNDPRTTSVGKFLRRISFDELPQLWNVIKGEMSLVGPRPYLSNEVENLKQEMVIISKVTPGLSGLWQVSGRSHLSFEERIRLDEYYVKNWTIWLDLVILIKTIKVMFSTQGAY